MQIEILKRKKGLLITFSVLALLAFVLIINNIYVYCLCLLLVLSLYINQIVYQKNTYNARHLFDSIGRNYDYLVIGELCDISSELPKDKTSISFLAPNRCVYGSFMLLQRLYSLLKEDEGTFILVANTSQKRISIFDIPYIQKYTLKQMSIFFKKYLSYFPLFYSPIDSLKILFNHKKKGNLKEEVLSDNDIINFCKSRNIKIIYKIID